MFLTAIRPFVALKQEEYGIVGRIVSAREQAGGLGRVGVHRLRHTVATEALRAGAPLEEIASLLASSRLGDDDGVREGRLGPAQRARPPVAGGAGMTGLDEAVSDYLTIRRALGFKLVEHQRLLPQFASFLEQAGADTITTELAVEWASRRQRG